MFEAAPSEKIYPSFKLAMLVEALAEEGVPAREVLASVGISERAVTSPDTRLSLDQRIQCCRNALRLSRDPRFAYHLGLRFHISTHGMFGFALLSSTTFRRTIEFAVKYQQLAAPLADVILTEQNGTAAWIITPVAHPAVDAQLYQFLVELQFGIHIALHQDVMGSDFAARELWVTYGPPDDAAGYPEIFGCPVLFGQPENRLLFDSAWLEREAELGNEMTHAAVVKICDSLMEEFNLRIGLVGKVRQILLTNLMRTVGFDAIATEFNMSARTLRRKLLEEDTSYRKIADELRRDLAIKYLRDTEMTVDDIGYSLGFSDVASFRHAFRRWTEAAPSRFRGIARAKLAPA